MPSLDLHTNGYSQSQAHLFSLHVFLLPSNMNSNLYFYPCCRNYANTKHTSNISMKYRTQTTISTVVNAKYLACLSRLFCKKLGVIYGVSACVAVACCSPPRSLKLGRFITIMHKPVVLFSEDIGNNMLLENSRHLYNSLHRSKPSC